MGLDPAPIGTLAAELMDLLERDYAGRDVSMRAAMVIVDLEVPDPNEPEVPWTHVRWRFGEAGNGWNPKRASSSYAAGLVSMAHTGLTDGTDNPPPGE